MNIFLQIKSVGEYKVDLDRELGGGRFGTVYKATDSNEKFVAAKKIHYADTNMELKNAVKQQEKCIHKNVVRIFGVTTLDDKTWIFMEFLPRGDMQRQFRKYPSMLKNFDTKAALMTQIAEGLNYLHSVNVVHRDIKPENILVSKRKNANLTLKLADFGIAKFLEQGESTMKTNVGTFPYKAPEFWEVKSDGSLEYHRSIDVFSLGLTFLAIFQAEKGKPLVPEVENLEENFNHHVPIAFIMRNRKLYGRPELIVIEDKANDNKRVTIVKELIRQMTCLDPKKRKNTAYVVYKLQQVVGHESDESAGLKKFKGDKK